MSKLDNIVLKCVNTALAGKEEKLGDYIYPTKEEIKDLIIELISELNDSDWRKPINSDELRQRIQAL